MTRSLVERALRAGLRGLGRVHGVSVTYVRDSTTLTISNAIPVDQEFVTLADSGQEAVVEVLDFLIDSTLLTTGEPQIGDVITRVIDGTSHAYSVECPAPGVLHWEISETHRGWYRIHTREDGTYTLPEYNDFDLAGNELRYP